MTTIRIGSRGSQLALWQANHIATQLRDAGHTVEIEVIRTTGDRMQDPAFRPESEIAGAPLADGKGIFIKEIEEALAAGRIDLAVHSLKDLPTTLDPRFALTAIPPRADSRDAFVCDAYWALHTLPMHSRVGTTSPRRRAQLLHLRPDLSFVDLRGNIDTRLRKLADDQADALVLASAGLDRLNRVEWVHHRFSIDELTPAPGQGALALETRSPLYPLDTEDPTRDPAVFAAVRLLDCEETRFATTAERALLAGLGGGCELPLGAHCTRTAGRYHLYAQVLSPDGEQILETSAQTSPLTDPSIFGQDCAARLIDRGALDLLRIQD